MTIPYRPADRLFICPGCGGEVNALSEGYCDHCCKVNQEYLDQHNAEYDRWNTLDEWKRELEIKDAIRRA
jgi:hypothetical protein